MLCHGRLACEVIGCQGAPAARPGRVLGFGDRRGPRLHALGYDYGPGVHTWLRLGAHNASRTWILYVPALVIAGYSVHCWMVMSTGSRLVAEIVMNFWNFEEAALQFFLNDGTIVALLSVSGATQQAPNAISPGGTR